MFSSFVTEFQNNEKSIRPGRNFRDRLFKLPYFTTEKNQDLKMLSDLPKDIG